MSPLADVLGLALSLVLCYGIAFVGSRWTRPNLAWYEGIRKPPWTPPGRVIGTVWTVLYGLMAVAAWHVWRDAGGIRAAALPLGLFILQLALNAAWSGLFFGRHRPGVALADIILLWVAIAATAWTFLPVSPLAAALLAPYLAWVAFAAFLNFRVWRMNPARPAARGPRPIPR